MGVAYYPSFERAIAGFDPATAVNGKPVARVIERLDKICKRLRVTPLTDFYSESVEEAFAKIGEEVPEGMKEQPICWSEPSAGLRTVEGLIAYLEAHDEALPDAPGVIEDLEGLQQVLQKAQKHRTRFRLRIDI